MGYIQISALIITILCGVVTGYVVPWLKAKIGADKLEQIIYWVGVFVRAAEQMLKDSKGADKLDWVQDQIHAKGISMDAEAQRALIEAIVLEVKQDAANAQNG